MMLTGIFRRGAGVRGEIKAFGAENTSHSKDLGIERVARPRICLPKLLQLRLPMHEPLAYDNNNPSLTDGLPCLN